MTRGAATVSAAVAFGALALTVLGAARAQAQEGDGSVATATVTVRAQPPGDLDPPLVIDRLAPQTVLTIQARGFEPNTTGRVAQCVDGERCTNRHSARFDDDGYASFQYLVTNETDESGGCRLDGSRCTVELRAGDDEVVVDTVFIDAAPSPGILSIQPGGNLAVGDPLAVGLTGFAPGARATVLVCAAPSAGGPRCGAPGPEVPLTIGEDGAAEAEITVPAEVGVDRVACGRRSHCQVVVASDQIGVWARPARLGFADGPSPDYAGLRVVAGLTAALLLLALAALLIRRTDWRPPPEADASAIDDAEFADLDREAEEFVESTP